MKTKRLVDIGMTCLLLFLMAYQVTEQAAHEWLGMGMTALVILHQILNRKWYAALFRGKYGAVRILQTCVNVLLLSAFAASAVSGMALSEYAVPLLRGALPPVTARVTHLAASYWSFLLMGLHLGFHWGAITAKLRLSGKIRVCAALAAGYGLFLFLRNGVPGYLTFRTHFAYLDYETPAPLVLLENALMLLFWTWLAFEIAGALHARRPRRLAYVSAVLLIGAALFILGGGSVNDGGAWEADGNAWEINGGDDEASGLKDISEREAQASGSLRFAQVGNSHSAYYSGGAAMPRDVADWLSENSIS